MEPVQFTFYSYEAISFIFRIYSSQIYNFRLMWERLKPPTWLNNLILTKINCGRGPKLLKNLCFSQFSLVANNFRVITNLKGSITINFGEAFIKRNIRIFDISKTKETYKYCVKIILVYSVKCVLRCFITKYIQKHIQD